MLTAFNATISLFLTDKPLHLLTSLIHSLDSLIRVGTIMHSGKYVHPRGKMRQMQNTGLLKMQTALRSKEGG